MMNKLVKLLDLDAIRKKALISWMHVRGYSYDERDSFAGLLSKLEGQSFRRGVQTADAQWAANTEIVKAKQNQQDQDQKL